MHRLIGSLAHISSKLMPNLYKNPLAAKCVQMQRDGWAKKFCKLEIEKYLNSSEKVAEELVPEFLKVNPPKFEDVKQGKTVFMICFGGEENATKIEKANISKMRYWVENGDEKRDLILITYENMFDYIYVPDDIKEVFQKARTSTHQTKGSTSGHHPIGVSSVMYLFFWYLLAKYSCFATMSISLLLDVPKTVSSNPNPIDYIFKQGLWTKTHTWGTHIAPGYPKTFKGQYDQNYWKTPNQFYPLAVFMVEMQIKYLRSYDYFISYSLPVFYLQLAYDKIPQINKDLKSIYKLTWDENNMWLRERIENNAEFIKEDYLKNRSENSFAVGTTRHVTNPIYYIDDDKTRPTYYQAIIENLL